MNATNIEPTVLFMLWTGLDDVGNFTIIRANVAFYYYHFNFQATVVTSLQVGLERIMWLILIQRFSLPFDLASLLL